MRLYGGWLFAAAIVALAGTALVNASSATSLRTHRASEAAVGWGKPRVADPSVNYLWSVSCPVSTYCVAADFNGNVLTYDGSGWSAPVNVVAAF